MKANLPFAIAGALGTFAWYALPDAVGSRPLRAALKVGLAAGGGAVANAFLPAPKPTSGPDLADEIIHAANLAPLAAAGIAAAGVAAVVVGEKALYRLGERRRARGVRWAHAAPALGWAVLAGLSLVVEPPRP